MGNCQAIDAATLVIQHPSGKVDKLYWPVTATEIMKSNPGHYVALLLSTTLCPPSNSQCPPHKDGSNTTTTNNNNGSVRLTRIKLLRPTDTLALGHVYRLLTSQEVTKVMLAKKQKMKKNLPDSAEKHKTAKRSDLHKDHQVGENERNRERAAAAAANRSRTAWQPSLKSISEAGS